jgi:hypothetical protein
MTDAALVLKWLPELAVLADDAVEALWSVWSEDAYCASWLDVTEDHASAFRKWALRTDPEQHHE